MSTFNTASRGMEPLDSFKSSLLKDRFIFFETIVLVLFFFSLPFSETLKTISFILLVFLFFIRRFFYVKTFRLRFTPFLIGLLFYCFCGLIISFFALDLKESLKGWLDLLFFTSIYIILINEFYYLFFKKIVEWSLIINTFLAVLWGIVFWKILWHKPYFQIISLGYYNHTSIFLGLVLILNFCKLLWDKSLSKFQFCVLFITFLFLALGLVLTTSRASLLGIVSSFLFLFFYKGSADKKIISFLFLFFLSFIIGFSLSKEFQKRIFNVGPVVSRIHIWKAGLRAFKDHPIFGVGLRCFGKIDSKYYGKYIGDRVDHAHNLFLNNLTQMGVLGLLSLLFCLYTAFLSAYKAVNNYRKYAAYASIVFVIVNGIFNTTFRWEHAIAFVTIIYLLDYEKEAAFY